MSAPKKESVSPVRPNEPAKVKEGEIAANEEEEIADEEEQEESPAKGVSKVKGPTKEERETYIERSYPI